MRRRGAVPPVLLRALASPGGTCYRHCDQPIRIRRVTSRLPGVLFVRACPTGLVSLTVYLEWTRRDPSRSLQSVLERWASPRTLVRWRDLRLATRHGPELGPTAERFLASMHPARAVRAVYWRVYPSRAADGAERRLFVCTRRSHSSPVFFAASPQSKCWDCPACARRPKRRAARRIG